MTQKTSRRPLYVHYSGSTLLEIPLLNKSSAFTQEERTAFNLTGLLPPRYETIEEQLERAYLQYSSFREPINKHIYLRAIQDSNETLFHALIQRHLEEMMPIIYTPTVGDACERFSDIYRNNRGLFIAWEDRENIDDILRNAIKQKVKVIVVTDGERILGLGDQGIGGMGIPIGKLSLYTSCGGISPAYTLPIMLDVGTNNQALLDDPMYMGARHERIAEQDYAEFIELVIDAVSRRWPMAMIQFEDFAQANAMPLLKKFQDRVCCFNDDIQGTASVTVGTLLAACRAKGERLSEQRVAFAGAGSAGCGIAEQIIAQMVSEGLAETEARRRIYMVDRHGLVTQGMEGLRDFQEKLVQPLETINDWQFGGDYPALLDVVQNSQVTILIGVSGQKGLFGEQIIKAMLGHSDRPIIFPLSNPSRQIEATPQQVLEWTDGRAIVATGSPFQPVVYQGKQYPIAQCNNAYIFPGIGLGVISANIKRITEEMLMVASETLAQATPDSSDGAPELLPPLTRISELSRKIAFAVAKIAQQQGHALEMTDEMLLERIEANYWKPAYRQYRRVSR